MALPDWGPGITMADVALHAAAFMNAFDLSEWLPSFCFCQKYIACLSVPFCWESIFVICVHFCVVLRLVFCSCGLILLPIVTLFSFLHAAKKGDKQFRGVRM